MATTTKLSTQEQVARFKAACVRLGWEYSVKPQIVTIQKTFTPGDKDAYVDCEIDSYELMSLVPLTGGSTWGTDSASVGGYAGLNGGYYRLNKSGSTGLRFIKALSK